MTSIEGPATLGAQGKGAIPEAQRHPLHEVDGIPSLGAISRHRRKLIHEKLMTRAGLALPGRGCAQP